MWHTLAKLHIELLLQHGNGKIIQYHEIWGDRICRCWNQEQKINFWRIRGGKGIVGVLGWDLASGHLQPHHHLETETAIPGETEIHMNHFQPCLLHFVLVMWPPLHWQPFMDHMHPTTMAILSSQVAWQFSAPSHSHTVIYVLGLLRCLGESNRKLKNSTTYSAQVI